MCGGVPCAAQDQDGPALSHHAFVLRSAGRIARDAAARGQSIHASLSRVPCRAGVWSELTRPMGTKGGRSGSPKRKPFPVAHRAHDYDALVKQWGGFARDEKFSWKSLARVG